MPSAYTESIKDRIAFNEFAMLCARAMGACIMMRDEPLSTPIPERFEPSDYHLNKSAALREVIARVEAMSTEEAEAAASENYRLESEANANAAQRADDVLAKYELMLQQVKAWTPPTEDHQGLREFMIEQIESSMRFDCDRTYYDRHQPVKQTGEQWKQQVLDKAMMDLRYHLAEHEKEIERTEARNKWIAELRQSLKVEA